jgi:hypothetical protein
MPIVSRAGTRHSYTEIEIALALWQAMIRLGPDEDHEIVVGEKGDCLRSSFARVGAPAELLRIIDTYGSGRTDADVLAALSIWNCYQGT